MCPGPQDAKAPPGESYPRVEPLLYRPAEAAELLLVSPSKLYELMNSGEIPWMRLGGVRRLPVEALRQLTGESHPRVPQMEPLFYRPAEAAAALRVSRSKVYELMKRARSPGCGWEGSAACPWRHFGNSYGRGSLIDGTRLPVGTAGPTGDRCPNAGSRLRRCVLAAAHTTSQALPCTHIIRSGQLQHAPVVQCGSRWLRWTFVRNRAT